MDYLNYRLSALCLLLVVFVEGYLFWKPNNQSSSPRISFVRLAGWAVSKCTSINHSNPECEDKFNNTDNKYWDGDCWAYRKKREGTFPGTQCIKMKAEDDKTGYSVVVRNCVVDNGGTNSETEIGRLTHCGWLNTIDYDGKRMRGCILACDTDGCNTASRPPVLHVNLLLVLMPCTLSALLTPAVWM